MTLVLATRDYDSVTCRKSFSPIGKGNFQLSIQNIPKMTFHAPVMLHEFVCELNQAQLFTISDNSFGADTDTRLVPRKLRKVYFRCIHIRFTFHARAAPRFPVRLVCVPFEWFCFLSPLRSSTAGGTGKAIQGSTCTAQGKSNVRVDRARRLATTSIPSNNLKNAQPALRSNDLLYRAFDTGHQCKPNEFYSFLGYSHLPSFCLFSSILGKQPDESTKHNSC
jgi:hypothetical protein